MGNFTGRSINAELNGLATDATGTFWQKRVHNLQRYGRTRLLRARTQQKANILNGGDQIILDLLAPQPPPTRTLEVMVVGGIGEARLHQVLPRAQLRLGERRHGTVGNTRSC